MIDKDYIQSLIDEFVEDTDLFLVELKISSDNKIRVFLDGDSGVPIKSCVDVSRKIESSLNREEQDFELEVSSVGLDKPLQTNRQFVKNCGRLISFLDEENKKITAKLIDADSEAVVLELQDEKKKNKKLPAKKSAGQEPIRLSYDKMKEVKIVPSFK